MLDKLKFSRYLIIFKKHKKWQTTILKFLGNCQYLFLYINAHSKTSIILMVFQNVFYCNKHSQTVVSQNKRKGN